LSVFPSRLSLVAVAAAFGETPEPGVLAVSFLPRIASRD
jgi:hypothetical protein